MKSRDDLFCLLYFFLTFMVPKIKAPVELVLCLSRIFGLKQNIFLDDIPIKTINQFTTHQVDYRLIWGDCPFSFKFDIYLI